MYNALRYISIISAFAPLLLGILKYKTFNRTLRVLFLYITLCVLTDILSFIFSGRTSKQYYFIQNSFTLLEFYLLCLIYYFEFTSKVTRKIIVGLCIGYALLALIFFGIYKSFLEPTNLFSTLDALIMLGLSASFFYRVDADMNIPRLGEYYFFWFNSALLIYFSMALILFLFDDFLERCDLKTFQILWSMHLLVNISYNLLIATALWKAKSKQQYL